MKRYIRASLDKYWDNVDKCYFIPLDEYPSLKSEVQQFLKDNEEYELVDDDAEDYGGISLYLKDGYDLGINFDIWDDYDWTLFIDENVGGGSFESILGNLKSGRCKTYLREMQNSNYIAPGYAKAFKDYIDCMTPYWDEKKEAKRIEKEKKQKAHDEWRARVTYIDTDLPKDQVVDAYVEVLKKDFPITEETLLHWNKSKIYRYLQDNTTNDKKDNNRVIWKMIDSIYRRYYELCDNVTSLSVGTWYRAGSERYLCILGEKNGSYIYVDWGDWDIKSGYSVYELINAVKDTLTSWNGVDSPYQFLKNLIENPFDPQYKNLKTRKDKLMIDPKNVATTQEMMEFLEDACKERVGILSQTWYINGYQGNEEVFSVDSLDIFDAEYLTEASPKYDYTIVEQVRNQYKGYNACTSYVIGHSVLGIEKTFTNKQFHNIMNLRHPELLVAMGIVIPRF